VLAAAGCIAAAVLFCRPAHAERLALSLVVQGSVAGGAAQHLPLSVAAAYAEPDVLRGKDLRLDGAGPVSGGGYKLVIASPRWRGGLGVHVLGASGFDLEHKALPDGMHLGTGTLWGMAVDTFFGRQWGVGRAQVYLELRTALHVLQAMVKLRSDTYGLLGATPYNAYSLCVGPRIGVAYPLSKHVFVDTTLYGSPVGVEKFAVTFGLGITTGRARLSRPPKRVPGTW
jgi:hypothetical protein